MIEIVKHFTSAKKPIAAICHVLQVLTAAGGDADASAAVTRPSARRRGPGGKYADIPVDEARDG